MGPIHESICITPLAAVVSLDRLRSAIPGEGERRFDIPEDLPAIEEVLDAQTATSAVRSFMGSLPPGHRDLLERIFWNDENQASVARSKGVSGAAISKSLNKILETGRRKLARFKNMSLNGL
jgi:DNA-directed RNA polymerase specialized sigma24 family protein